MHPENLNFLSLFNSCNMASDSNNPCDSVNNIYLILKFKKVKVNFFYCFTVHFDSLNLIHTNQCTSSLPVLGNVEVHWLV